MPAEVERKTYRESLQNNREQILLSKELVTIKCDVDIELDVEKMHAGEPDVEALREFVYRTGIHLAAERTAAGR